MPITGPSSYVPTMNAFDAHWLEANVRLGVKPYIVRLPDGNATMTQAQFATLRSTLQTQQFAEIVPAGFAAIELVVTAATARQLLELRGSRGVALPAGVRLAIMRVQ